MGVKINDTDLTDLGIGLTRLRGWSDRVEASRDAVQVAGLRGQVEGTTVEASPRTVQVEGRIRGNTVATRNAVLEAALAHCRGRCEIVPEDQPDKLVVGYLERTRVEGIHDILVMDLEAINVRLDFRCYDPLYRSTVATVAAFDATARDVPMGTGPHRGIITITGQPTDPTITVRDFRGAEVASMEFTGTLAASQALLVDLYEQTITLSSAGVLAPADGLLVDGAFFFFRQEWANPTAESWPTLEIDDGEGSISYFRRWMT